MTLAAVGAMAGEDLSRPPVTPDPSAAVRGKRVVIVGINYWPEPTGIAPYTTAIAEHLAQSAASVTVLGGLPCYPSWRVADPYRGKRTFVEERNGVTVHRLAHVVPRRQDALRRGAYELSYFAHAAATRLPSRVDLVLGVTPALGGAAAAVALARRTDARLVVQVQDLLGAAATQSGLRGGGAVAGAVGGVESWVLRQADAVAVVSDAFRRPLTEYGVASSRIHTVRNWSRSTTSTFDRAAVRADLGWPDDVIVALHTGNMGLKQDLDNIIRAACLTRSRHDLRWILMGDGSQRARLEAAGAGLRNLQFLPLCPDDEYDARLAAADVLLLNERAGVSEMCLPSKLTGYFMSGRPVVGAVDPDGATAAELASAGAPLPVRPNDPSALVELVDQLSASPERRHAHGVAGLRHARSALGFASSMAQLEALL